MEIIIGLILSFISTIIAAITLYYTVKKDNSPSLNILGHATLVNNDNSINVKINDYYSNTGKRRDNSLNKIQSVLVEFIGDSIKVINNFKRLALIVAAIFTFTHVVTVYFDIDIFLTAHLKLMLNINNGLWVYAFAYVSLFILIYSFVLLIITAYYSKELYYQSRIRKLIDTTKLTVLKEILTEKFGYRNFDEFPMNTLDKMMHNIVIERENQNNKVYNNKTKNPGNKKPYTIPKSVFFGNVYFKVIAAIVVANIAFLLFYSPKNLELIPLPSPLPVVQIHHEKVCKSAGGNYISNSANWQSNWKRSANILCDFTTLNAPNGFYVLNSPNINDVNKYENDQHVEVSGYVRTRNQKFYFTKYSYESSNPKLVYIPTH